MVLKLTRSLVAEHGILLAGVILPQEDGRATPEQVYMFDYEQQQPLTRLGGTHWLRRYVPLSSGAPRLRRAQSARAKLYWTIGNALMLFGIILLLYVGGLYAHAEYMLLAARGDNDIPPPLAVSARSSDEPAPFIAPFLNQSDQASAVLDQTSSAAHDLNEPHVTRIVIPSIGVDSKVVPVGWEIKMQRGKQVAIWQVAEYAVGQHRGSGNPGQRTNIVLAGHVGGYGKVFKNLFYTKPGDTIALYSNGLQYLYIVREHLVLTEEGVSADQQAENARYIAPTDHEVVTLVSCWPPTGPEKYKQRVVIRAVPFNADGTTLLPALTNWTIR